MTAAGALSFTAPFLEALPVDPVEGNRRRQVRAAVASRVRPTPVERSTPPLPPNAPWAKHRVGMLSCSS